MDIVLGSLELHLKASIQFLFSKYAYPSQTTMLSRRGWMLSVDWQSRRPNIFDLNSNRQGTPELIVPCPEWQPKFSGNGDGAGDIPMTPSSGQIPGP